MARNNTRNDQMRGRKGEGAATAAEPFVTAFPAHRMLCTEFPPLGKPGIFSKQRAEMHQEHKTTKPEILPSYRFVTCPGGRAALADGYRNTCSAWAGSWLRGAALP